MRKIVALSLLAWSLTSLAIEADLYLGAGLDFGGDKLAGVTFTNGDSESLDAGEGLTLAIGVDVYVKDDIMLRATVGKKTESIDSTTGDIEFSRTVIDVLAYKMFKAHGVGMGLTMHNSVELECDILLKCNGQLEFDDTQGFVVEYLYTPERTGIVGYSVGVRYTSIDYTSGSTEVDGSALGFTAGVKY